MQKSQNGRKTGKTESLFILNYLTAEKPPLTLSFETQKKAIDVVQYAITQKNIQLRISAADAAAIDTKKDITAHFYMQGTEFLFAVNCQPHSSGTDDTVLYADVPFFFTASGLSKKDVKNGITFLFNMFCGYAALSAVCRPEITAAQEFQVETNRKCRNWFDQPDDAARDSGVFTAAGELLAIQPKVVAAGFAGIKKQDIPLVPQPGDKGTATLRIGGRVCDADAVCVKAVMHGSRLCAVYSLHFIYPEDTRFFYEYFFHDICPDFMIPPHNA